MIRRARHVKSLWIAAVTLGASCVAVLALCGTNATNHSLRCRGFPDTYISRIHLKLTSPNHWVTLTWSGPNASKQNAGPFRSSPGAGWGTNDCNDPVESNCPGSNCTPKGLRYVEALRDQFNNHPECKYLTVIDRERGISFHSHDDIPPYPASQGCVRLESQVAQLIFENSLVGRTEVLVDGEWTLPQEGVERHATPDTLQPSDPQ